MDGEGMNVNKAILLQSNRKSYVGIMESDVHELPVDAIADCPKGGAFANLTSYYGQKLSDAREAGYHCIAFYGQVVAEHIVGLEDTVAISLLSIRRWFVENPDYDMGVWIGCEDSKVYEAYYRYMDMLKKRDHEVINLDQADALLKAGKWKQALDLYNKAYYQARDKQDTKTYPMLCLKIVRLFGEKLSQDQLGLLLREAKKYFQLQAGQGADVASYLDEIKQLEDWYF